MIGVATVFGFYKISVTNTEKRMCRKEQREGRMAIMPFLTAESDVAKQAEYNKALAYEANLMKNVPGWKVGESVMSKGAKWQAPTAGLNTSGLGLGDK
jgi:NADH dehydrogenase (ubiquinone) 1 alpha subcomplex subunit 13